jgi:hypothetical protein
MMSKPKTPPEPIDDLIDDAPTTTDAADQTGSEGGDRAENDLLADTIAERITEAEITDARQAAEHLGEDDREKVRRIARSAEAAFSCASSAEERSTDAKVRLYGDLYEAILELVPNVAWLLALCVEREVRLTQASRNSPCLAPVKALLPEVDQKHQSFMAKVLNHGLALRLDREGMERLVREKGVVAIAKLETLRQKERRGQEGRLSDEQAVAQFKRERRGAAVSGVVPPENGMVLMIGEVIGGQVFVYDIDNNEKRLMAVIRSAVKRGSQLLDTSRREGGQTDETAPDEGEN